MNVYIYILYIIDYYPSKNTNDLIGLQIVTLGHEFNKRTSVIPNIIPSTDISQPNYTNQNTICIQAQLDPGVYIIIPNTLYRNNTIGKEYYLSVYGNGISISKDDDTYHNLDNYNDIDTIQQSFEKLYEEENSQFPNPEEAISKLEELKYDNHPIEFETLINFLANCGVSTITKEIEELLLKLSDNNNHYYYYDIYCLYNYISYKQQSDMIISSSNRIIDDIIYKKYNCKGKIIIDLLKQKNIKLINYSNSNMEDIEEIPIYFDKIKEVFIIIIILYR